MRNVVSGEIRELTLDQFLNLFSEPTREAIVANIAQQAPEGLACLEPLRLGRGTTPADRLCLSVGDHLKVKMADLPNHRVNLPDRKETFYPVAIWKVITPTRQERNNVVQ